MIPSLAHGEQILVQWWSVNFALTQRCWTLSLLEAASSHPNCFWEPELFGTFLPHQEEEQPLSYLILSKSCHLPLTCLCVFGIFVTDYQYQSWMPRCCKQRASFFIKLSYAFISHLFKAPHCLPNRDACLSESSAAWSCLRLRFFFCPETLPCSSWLTATIGTQH